MTSIRSKYRKIDAQVSKIIANEAKNYGESNSIQLSGNNFTPSASLDLLIMNEEKFFASNIDYCQANFDKFSPSLSDESSTIAIEASTAGLTKFSETFINMNFEPVTQEYNFSDLELDECCEWVYRYFDSDTENENDTCKNWK